MRFFIGVVVGSIIAIICNVFIVEIIFPNLVKADKNGICNIKTGKTEYGLLCLIYLGGISMAEDFGNEKIIARYIQNNAQVIETPTRKYFYATKVDEGGRCLGFNELIFIDKNDPREIWFYGLMCCCGNIYYENTSFNPSISEEEQECEKCHKKNIEKYAYMRWKKYIENNGGKK